MQGSAASLPRATGDVVHVEETDPDRVDFTAQRKETGRATDCPPANVMQLQQKTGQIAASGGMPCRPRRMNLDVSAGFRLAPKPFANRLSAGVVHVKQVFADDIDFTAVG